MAEAVAEALSPLLQSHLLPLVGVSALSYVAVAFLIPRVAPKMPAKLSGKDLCKRGTPAGDIPMYVRCCAYYRRHHSSTAHGGAFPCSPEAMGIVSGVVYVAALAIVALFIVDDPDLKVRDVLTQCSLCC